jgi:2-polyprenyl-3-methyl-5-hydroxy-6-metoxy-1,4-benzoquinol methylase
MKILVAIANFGTKNAKYLKRLINEYRSMTRYKVHIVVLSNIPKDLGPDIEVIVGLPTKNPWSLPFGHKTLFTERLHQYDLFIYSEDDTLITERHIDAFVEVSEFLPDNYIAGFIRYELSKNGKKYYSTIHSHYHWDPNSVLKIGNYIFAHYTNDHSACFILTQNQLKKAIDSGGFLLPAREGRYDMLVTAATDPYTKCGMKKLICISHLNDFCLHHLPDIYCGRIGIDSEIADLEIEKLKSLSENNDIRGPLFETCTLLEDSSWDKKYYESCRKDILTLIPKCVKRVLSIGCGCGSTESELVYKGIEVVGIPLDCVILESAASKGVKLLPPNFEAALEALDGEKFDCIIFSDVLNHLHHPISTLIGFLKMLSQSGSIIISIPNFYHPSVIRKRILGKLPFFTTDKSNTFEKYHLHFTTMRMLNSWLNQCKLIILKSYKNVEPRYEFISCLTLGIFDRLMSRNIVVLAKKS